MIAVFIADHTAPRIVWHFPRKWNLDDFNHAFQTQRELLKNNHTPTEIIINFTESSQTLLLIRCSIGAFRGSSRQITRMVVVGDVQKLKMSYDIVERITGNIPFDLQFVQSTTEFIYQKEKTC